MDGILNIFILLLVAGVVTAITRICEGDDLGTYNPDTDICCGKKVPTHGKPLQCCKAANNTVYNSESHGCCGSHVHDKGKLCCGGELYDNGNNILACCQDSSGTSEVFYKKNGICCNGSVSEQLKNVRMCCHGNQAYEQKGHSCGPPGIRQCGTQEYNEKTEVCCKDSGKVLKLPETSFNSKALYTCSKGVLVDASIMKVENVNGAPAVFPQALKKCGNNEHYIDDGRKGGIQYHCCNGHLRTADHGRNVGCCGAELYDMDERSCCNGALLSTARPLKCCVGFLEYNSLTDDCCNEQIIARKSFLCGRVHSKESKIRKASDDHDDSCYISSKRSFETFSTKEKVCHDYKLLTIKEFEELLDSKFKTIIKPENDNKSGYLDKKSGINKKTVCPFVECANGNNSSPAECRKRNEIHFFTYEVRQFPGKTFLKAVITYPPTHAGEKVRLRTNYNCDACFEQYDSYRLYTNRYTRNFSSKLRFSARDYLVKVGSDFHCMIDRYAKKQQRKGL